MVVVDKLPGQVENALWLHARVQQVGHPLLEDRRLAHPSTTGDRVHPRLINGEVRQDGVAVGDGQPLQFPELRIHGAEQRRIVEMQVVRGKARVDHCDLDNHP